MNLGIIYFCNCTVRQSERKRIKKQEHKNGHGDSRLNRSRYANVTEYRDLYKRKGKIDPGGI